ncbi:hypothetical protein HPP92_018580 [Vanilla planifolia]|uniref:Uncharacterized protein n=1 Tax=Vanilla planifolia TaxID=51239 RepID=A0A835Q5Z7_VANPL|nr:hypothetical protein HPP92_018580 [Vanilla planifolia]
MEGIESKSSKGQSSGLTGYDPSGTLPGRMNMEISERSFVMWLVFSMGGVKVVKPRVGHRTGLQFRLPSVVVIVKQVLILMVTQPKKNCQCTQLKGVDPSGVSKAL